MVAVKINIESCTGCGTCVDACPEKVFALRENDGRKLSKVVAEDNCFACRACAS